MGTSADGRRIARQAKIRLYQHDDGGPPLALHWHWMGWDDSDGQVVDTGSGSYTGDADEISEKLDQLLTEIGRHMHRGMNPFGTIPRGAPGADAIDVAVAKLNGALAAVDPS